MNCPEASLEVEFPSCFLRWRQFDHVLSSTYPYSKSRTLQEPEFSIINYRPLQVILASYRLPQL